MSRGKRYTIAKCEDIFILSNQKLIIYADILFQSAFLLVSIAGNLLKVNETIG